MFTLIRRFLFLFNPEMAHHFSMAVLQFFSSLRPMHFLLRGCRPRVLDPVEVAGLQFPNRVGLAAGFDKNARYLRAAHALGFGHVEVGTITPRPQAGNPKPRLFRLPGAQALINRMGFNNDGMDMIVKRIKNRPAGLILGCNLGKNKDTPLHEAHIDYLSVMQCFYGDVDYFTVNVSSPNTPQLRQLQESAWLNKILEPLVDYRRQQKNHKPIFLKIAPDIEDDQIREVADVAVAAGIDGIIATNTTINRSALMAREQKRAAQYGEGGLSGAPLTERAHQLTQSLVLALDGRLPVLASGGIMSVEIAESRFNSGASLIQLYTGFVYSGPELIYRIARLRRRNTGA